MNNKTIIFLNSLSFVIGFTLVFSTIGILLETVLRNVQYNAVTTLRLIGGSIIILFGVMLIASLKYSIPILQKTHKLKIKKFNISYITSFVFGGAFAVGWTPCVGFILGAIYALAATSPTTAFALLFTYSLGLGIPFLLAGAFISKFSYFLEKSQKLLKYFNIIGGLFLIFVGLLVVTNYVGIISSFFFFENVDIRGQLNFVVAFIAGLLSFFSPCILPLVPAYLSYMAGTSLSKK